MKRGPLKRVRKLITHETNVDSTTFSVWWLPFADLVGFLTIVLSGQRSHPKDCGEI